MTRLRPKVFPNTSSGFTIIEILIVLAIAGLILSIIFLVVPAAQRNARNHTRRVAVDYTSALMSEYYSQLGFYPLSGSADNRTSFVNGLKNEGPARSFDILYSTNSISHQYPYDDADGPEGAMGQIVIFPAHRCNRDASPGSADYPVESSALGDSNYNAYAAYTVMEQASGTPRVYCVDSEN